MIKKLQELGITVVEISSDGDSRLINAMRIKTTLGIKTPTFEAVSDNLKISEFHANKLLNFICKQDTVHIGGKLKSRLLKPLIILPLGNFMISSGHPAKPAKAYHLGFQRQTFYELKN